MKQQQYWKKTIRFVSILLGVWFLVSFPISIIFSEELDQFHIGGFKLGFWMAQQGSIIFYIIILAIYVWKMDKLDAEFNVADEPQKIAEH